MPPLEDAYPGAAVRRFEALHFAVRNAKLVIGLAVVLAFLVAAIAGPWLTDATPFEFGYPLGEPPSSAHWLGTTAPGQDVYSQFVYGLRSSFIVGALAATVAALLGMAIGFLGGYLGGVDRRGPEHGDEHRARDSDAGGAHHRVGVPDGR